MEKLELLIKNYPNEFQSLVDNLYKEKFKKNKKTIYHFKALGKIYDDDIFSVNYINFLKDISKIHGIGLFRACIQNSYISETPDGFSNSKVVKNSIQKISDKIYISTYNSTEKKIEHIKNICDMIDIKLVEIS